MVLLTEKEGIGLNCSKEDSGKTLGKHHVRSWEIWRNWASPPPKSVFYFYSQQNIQDFCCSLLAREVLSLSLSVHMAFCKARAIEGTTGTARQVLLRWLPGDCITALLSSTSSSWGCRLCLPWQCSSGQRGRLRSGPGMAETAAQESPTPGCWGVLRWISDSDTGAELLLYRHNWTFVPHSPPFPPDLCIIFCLPKLPYLQL